MTFQRFSVGDRVEVINKWGDRRATLTIVSVGTRSLKTDDGRSWTQDGIRWGQGSSMLGSHISKVV